jgi:hypothetical protein
LKRELNAVQQSLSATTETVDALTQMRDTLIG